MSKIEIKKLRDDMGLTQAEFAAKVGVTQGTVSLWESGERQPTGPAVRLLQIIAAQESCQTAVDKA